jgi:hypothetical protein
VLSHIIMSYSCHASLLLVGFGHETARGRRCAATHRSSVEFDSTVLSVVSSPKPSSNRRSNSQ